jgi:hypothetical protein
MTDEEIRRMMREPNRSRSKADWSKLAKALSRTDLAQIPSGVLLPGRSHGDVRRLLASLPAWDHTEGTPGGTKSIDSSCLVRKPSLQWTCADLHPTIYYDAPLLASPLAVISVHNNGLVALDSNNGKILWHYDHASHAVGKGVPQLRRISIPQHTWSPRVAITGDCLVLADGSRVSILDVLRGTVRASTTIDNGVAVGFALPLMFFAGTGRPTVSYKVTATLDFEKCVTYASQAGREVHPQEPAAVASRHVVVLHATPSAMVALEHDGALVARCSRALVDDDGMCLHTHEDNNCRYVAADGGPAWEAKLNPLAMNRSYIVGYRRVDGARQYPLIERATGSRKTLLPPFSIGAAIVLFRDVLVAPARDEPFISGIVIPEGSVSWRCALPASSSEGQTVDRLAAVSDRIFCRTRDGALHCFS